MNKTLATPQVPFLDLVQPHMDLRDELLAVVNTAFESAGFIGGPMVESFERNFAAFCGAAHCAGVGSGTDALRFALAAGGIRAGTTVLTVANTFIATGEAISQIGAYPEFIDIDELTYTMSAAAIRAYLVGCRRDTVTGRRLSPRTQTPVTAIVPVHLYGQMADMDAILDVAEEFHLEVFEDACQAHAAEYFSWRHQRPRRAGNFGRAAAFSFYPGKNLGACGEAGAVVTNDADCDRYVRLLRDHGQAVKYCHEIVGYNGRLDAIQAGFLDVKLRHLPHWTAQRRAAAAIYNELLAGVEGVIHPFEPAYSTSAYHLYAVRVADRQRVQKHLSACGIGTGIHYPVPLHLQNAYRHLGYSEGDLPVTELVAREVLSLPMFPGITVEQQRLVVKALVEAVQG